MSNIVTVPAGGKGRRPDTTAARPQRSLAPVLPTHSDRLHELARRVEQLGIAGRTDPEAIVLGKLTIAGEMRRMARELGQ